MKTIEKTITEKDIEKGILKSDSRLDLWTYFIQLAKAKKIAEIGVYKGDYAEKLLRNCDEIEKYYMIDPWRHLDDWNKPANQSDDIFEGFLSETKEKTEFAAEKRIILRGKTTEVIEEIPDSEIDFCYIDGDHTLKGIAIDLIRIYPKIRVGGWIGGDDFIETIWQHKTDFEPTFVFPFAVYFAEAVGARMYALPYGQFLLEKSENDSFSFIDLTEARYKDLNLRSQFLPDRLLKIKVAEKFPFAMRVASQLKNLYR